MEKDNSCQYRVIKNADGRWNVTTFRGATAGPEAVFTDEALPAWIRKDSALLSMVDAHSNIRSIGHRIGHAYWLQPKNSGTL
jgi:hypothetical protein